MSNEKSNRVKQYNTENTEIKKEYLKKIYREANKETITQNKKAKITCKCGCEIVKRILKQHQLTKKHIDLMNKNSI
jgi:hypothetical protein